MKAARLIANYLPQFHPTPENDRFWGNGFTEWTNVARAKPLFPGHYQPHIPADLGFYDLRLAETREQQAELARNAGIEAFCYWHYWFGGKRMMLERPLKEVAQSGKPDFPFCAGWANESWTGIWHGCPGKTLIEQTYPGRKDIEDHFQYLLPMFHDPRYLRVDSKPLFLIFRPMQIPNLERHLATWRELASRYGLPGLFLVAYEQDNWSPSKHGFDAATWAHQSILKWVHRDNHERSAKQQANGFPIHAYPYAEAIPWMHGPSYPDFPLEDDHFPSIVTGWDNSPRCGNSATILHDYHPELFRQHVRHVLDKVAQRPIENRIVFVKSWNEWAEGNYLEPEIRYGHAFLNILRDEMRREEKREIKQQDTIEIAMSTNTPPCKVEPSVPHAIRRRKQGGQLQGFQKEFFQLKEHHIPKLVQTVLENDGLRDADLLLPEYSTLDERVVEYAFAAECIAKAPRKGKLRLLDVGCVLNNQAIAAALDAHCDLLWLMNPSLEKPARADNIAYLLGDARAFSMPADLRFDLVTCLSTLEHFGMDNTRYGGTPAEFQGVIHDPERFALKGLENMANWVKPCGQILVSVPYGPFEYLYVEGQPEKPIYYTFDAPRLRTLQRLLSEKEFEVSTTIFKVVPEVGWTRCEIDDPHILRHAEDCASAGAVAFLLATRRN